MVVHSAATLVNYIPLQQVLGSTVAAAAIWSVKAWAGGRKCVWERDWAGKMILIVVSRGTRVDQQYAQSSVTDTDVGSTNNDSISFD